MLVNGIAFLLLVMWALLQAFATAAWVFAPVYKTRGIRPMKTQFTLVDVLVLAVEAQAALALVVLATPAAAVGERILLATVIVCMICGMWWGGVLILSRFGALDPWRRGVFLGLAIPLGYAGSFALAFITPLCFLLVLVGSSVQATFWGWLAALALLGSGVFVSRQLAERFARRSPAVVASAGGAP